jgi:hypothetical protein
MIKEPHLWEGTHSPTDRKQKFRNYRIIIFILLLSSYSLRSFAQKKINIFCRIALNGVIYYPKNLEKLLPDSLRAIELINPKNEYKFKDLDDILLVMGANGWRITSFDPRVDLYTLNKELTLDEKEWESYREKLKSIEQKLK